MLMYHFNLNSHQDITLKMEINPTKYSIEQTETEYNCHFCQQNIELHNIEKHFKTFHKFRGPNSSEFYCEFCDTDEIFQNEIDLLEHIKNIQHEGEKEIPNHSEMNLESLEEGKSKFLQLLVGFKSKDDALNLLYWIKCNDINISLF